MKITKNQLNHLIKEFTKKEFTPPSVKTNIDIEGLLRPENTKMINMLKVEGDVTIKIGDRTRVDPAGYSYIYLDNDMFPIGSIPDAWPDIVKLYDEAEGWDDIDESKNPPGFFVKDGDEGPEIFIKQALAIYCGDYNRIVIRDASSGAGVELIGEYIPLGNSQSFFYNIKTNLANNPKIVISEECA
jgi:hypothetical protein